MVAQRAHPALDLWRWAQANPAAHLVSRKLPAAPPQRPRAVVLHDVVLSRSFLRGRSEDNIFAEDAVLAKRLRRGLTFAELLPSEGEEVEPVVLARRGLPKFFDLDIDTLGAALHRCDSTTAVKNPSCGSAGNTCGEFVDRSARVIAGVSARESSLSANVSCLVERLQTSWLSGFSISVWRLAKANGENAQVSFFPQTQEWVLCSKNVALLANGPADLLLPHWSDWRYRFARAVGELWFDHLRNLTEARQACLRETLAETTLVGELLGGASHLVDCRGERSLQWFAIVPHDGEVLCWPPARSIAFLQKIGLPTVTVEIVGSEAGHSSVSGFAESLIEAAEAIEIAPLADAGEGSVLYFVASRPLGNGEPNAETFAETVGLGKLKTAEYRLMRRLREKAKHFARCGGSVLVDEIIDSYLRDSSRRPAEAARATEYSELLGQVCRYIYAEDLLPEFIDEHFLSVFQAARDFHGSVGPRPSAPAICVVAPPMLVDSVLLAHLGDMAKCHGGGKQTAANVTLPLCERLHSGVLGSAWHRSSASHPAVYLNHVPSVLELSSNTDSSGTAASSPQSKRRRIASAGQRHAASAVQIAEQLMSERCLFIFWGWSDEGCSRSLEVASSAEMLAETPSSGSVPECLPARREKSGRETMAFLTQTVGARGLLLDKWRTHADRFSRSLPRFARRLWFSGVPTLADSKAFATIAGELTANRRVANQAETARCKVIVLVPIGLPGMGKSSLLERLYSHSLRASAIGFRQGDIDPDGRVGSEFRRKERVGAEKREERLRSVAIVSSDAFVGLEMRSAGISRDGCSPQQLGRCRRRANARYRKAIEDFIAFAVADSESCRPVPTPEMESSKDTSLADSKPYLLILDKNHPPDALRREIETLAGDVPTCCDIRVKAAVLTSGLTPTPAVVSILGASLVEEEMREFGPWNYPWSLETILECAARLMLRAEHETLSPGQDALFIFLSFLRLHRGVNDTMLGASRGVQVLRIACVSLTPELASWQDSYKDSDESVWRRLELRALLREALLAVRPFSDQTSVAPLLGALAKCLVASGIRQPPSAAVASQADLCVEELFNALFDPPADAENTVAPPVAGVQYVALSCEAHLGTLEAALALAETAARTEIGNQPDLQGLATPDSLFPLQGSSSLQGSIGYVRPQQLHLTTLYVGVASTLTERHRHLLANSRRLHRQGAAFDMFVTHIVLARGALALALVESGPLLAAGVPLADDVRAHITLRTRPPWKPLHSNQVIAALPPVMLHRESVLARSGEGAQDHVLVNGPAAASTGGRWCRNLRVGGAILDVFVLRLDTPVMLQQNLLSLF